MRGLGAEGGPRPLPGADRRLWGQDVRRGRPVLPAAARGCSRDGPPELGGGAIPPRTPTPSPRRGTPHPYPSTLCLWAGPCRTLRTGGPTRQASFTAWPLRSLCRRLVHAGLGPASPLSGLRDHSGCPSLRLDTWAAPPSVCEGPSLGLASTRQPHAGQRVLGEPLRVAQKSSWGKRGA